MVVTADKNMPAQNLFFENICFSLGTNIRGRSQMLTRDPWILLCFASYCVAILFSVNKFLGGLMAL